MEGATREAQREYSEPQEQVAEEDGKVLGMVRGDGGTCGHLHREPGTPDDLRGSCTRPSPQQQAPAEPAGVTDSWDFLLFLLHKPKTALKHKNY